PDRLVLGVGPDRDDIEHRREVEVDARGEQLASPLRGAHAQRRWVHRALVERAWDRAEARTGEGLDDAALLIRRDEEANVRGRVYGGERLHRAGDAPHRVCAGRALLDEPDRSEVIGADRIHFGGTELVVREPQQEELPNPL